MALLRANTGIGITNPIVALQVDCDALFTGIVSATTFYGNVVGIATSAINLVGGVQGSLPYQSTVNSTTFLSPGVAGQVLITNGAGQNPTWVSSSALSGSFTGLTIKDEGTIVGSAASVSSINFVGPNVVATASGTGATITLSNDAQYLTGTAPGSVISQSSGLTVTGNLSISGNLSVGGTSVILNAATLQIKDKDIIVGITTNALNQDVSNDFTANHGGIAVASTEGSPLFDISAGVGTDNIPSTYKQIMWLKSGSFTGLNTDAWLFNYAVGVGTDQVPNGVRLAVGNVQFTQNDLSVVRNIYSTGVVTATQFVGSLLGNVTSADYAKVAGIATYANTAGIATYADTAGIATYANRAGIATYSNTAGIATYANSSGIATYSNTSGFSTFSGYSNTSGFSTFSGYSNTSGFSTFSGYSNTSGFSTFSGYSNTSGIATYATNAGIATNIKGGVAGNVPYQSATDATTFVTNGTVGQVLIFNGSVPVWGSASAASGAFSGITVLDEGTIVGSALSVSSLNFVGGNIVATSSGVGATITIASNLVGTALSISGISTFTNGPVLIGSGTSTGTASQPLQVTGNAYVSGNLGIGTTNPSTTLQIQGTTQIQSSVGNNNLSTWYDTYDSKISGFPRVSLLVSPETAYGSAGAGINMSATPVVFSHANRTNDGGSTLIPFTNITNLTASTAISTVIGIGFRNLVYRNSTIDLGSAAGSNMTGIINTVTQGINVNQSVITDNAYATRNIITFSKAGVTNIFTEYNSINIADTANYSASVTNAYGSYNIMQVGAASGTGTGTLTNYYGNYVSATVALTGKLTNYYGLYLATPIVSGIITNRYSIYSSDTSSPMYQAGSIGIGTTNPTSKLTVNGNVLVSGIITATTFSGNATSATYATSAGIATYATSSGVSTSVIGGIASVTSLNVSGISTLGTVQISSGIVTATAGVVTYYGDGSKLSGISASGGISSIAISANTANQVQYLTYAIGTGNTTGLGVTTTGLVFNPSTTRLGIGTTNPTSALTITGGDINLNDGGTYSTAFLTITPTANRFISLPDATGTVALVAGSNGQVTYNSAGIQSGSSAFTFDGSNVTLTGRLSVSGITTLGITSATNLTTQQLQVTGISTFTNGPVFIGAATSTGTASQRLQVTGGAYISTSTGIGTTNPTQLLHVQGNVRIAGGLYDSNNNVGTAGSVLSSTGSGLSWIAAGSGAGGISSVSISTSSATQSQFLTFVAGTGTTTGFGVSTTGLVFNPSTGNLGIGTTNPLQKAHILGNLLVAAGSSTGQHITQKAYELNSGTLSWEGTAGQLFSITNNLTSGSIFSVNDVSGIPSIDVDANGTVSMVSYGGSVGIGTTLATQRLHVQGNVRIAGALYDSNNNVGAANSILISTGAGISWTSSVASSGGISSVSISTNTTNQNQFLTFVAGTGSTTGFGVSTTGLVFNPSTGNLGIGTTNPLARLQVGAGLTQSVIITGIGSVGIGTTNPSQNLHVQGNARIGGSLYDNNNNVGTAGSVLSSTGSGLSWIAPGGSASISISTNTTNQTQYLTYVAGTGSTTGLGVSLTGIVFNPSTGNLGIGITTPAFKADIAGDARITSTNKMRFGGTTGTTNFYIQYNSGTYSLDFVAG